MYTCSWAYCATICDSLSQLDEHIFEHIAVAPPVQLRGIKRRKVAHGTWVSLGSERSGLGVDASQRSFHRISDGLPVHHSQADTSIATDTTYPIPSFPGLTQPPSFSQPPATYPIGASQQSAGQNLSGELLLSQSDDAEITDGMLFEYIRSPSPDQPSQGNNRRRSASPFVPPTQAYSTQLEGRRYPLSSSGEEPASQRDPRYFPPPTQSTNSQPSQPLRPSPDDSMEIGRAGPSQPLGPSPPDILSHVMPPPPIPVPSPRESIVRRASVNRPLSFGSVMTFGEPGVAAKPDVLVKEKVIPVSAGGPRRSVGFSFGSQLGSSSGGGKGDEQSK